jgi:ketosteroid isomerase-like protein
MEGVNRNDGGTDAIRDQAEREVRAAFEDYEAALLANDVAAMDTWFSDDERLVRFGIAEIQHSAEEVRAWRRQSPGVPLNRRHESVTITAFDGSTAIVALVFRNGTDAVLGRQSQVWRLLPDGWRIVHAHVSMMPTDRVNGPGPSGT